VVDLCCGGLVVAAWVWLRLWGGEGGEGASGGGGFVAAGCWGGWVLVMVVGLAVGLWVVAVGDGWFGSAVGFGFDVGFGLWWFQWR
jgi:hypothetical protein